MIIKNVPAFVFLIALAASACSGSETAAPLRSAPSSATTTPPTTTPSSSTVTVANDTGSSLRAEFASLEEPYASADYARGRRTFRLCQSCHTVTEGGPNLVGPNLHGLFGREVGTMPGYSYSAAVNDADFVWTPERLDEWLTNPRSFLRGHKMSFAGVRKPEDRLAVIAYLMVETAPSE